MTKYDSEKRKAYFREYRRNNPLTEEQKKRKSAVEKERYGKIVKWYREYKSTLSCEMCGEDHPATFDFHHRDPTQKSHDVSVMVAKCMPIEVIMAEIDKCAVLCANCHRKLHWIDRDD